MQSWPIISAAASSTANLAVHHYFHNSYPTIQFIHNLRNIKTTSIQLHTHPSCSIEKVLLTFCSVNMWQSNITYSLPRNLLTWFMKRRLQWLSVLTEMKLFSENGKVTDNTTIQCDSSMQQWNLSEIEHTGQYRQTWISLHSGWASRLLSTS